MPNQTGYIHHPTAVTQAQAHTGIYRNVMTTVHVQVPADIG